MSFSSSDISILPLTTGKYAENNTLSKVVNKCKAVAVTSKSSILANDCIASKQLYHIGRNLGWYPKAEITMHNYGMIIQLIGGVPPIPRDSKNKEIFAMLDDI